MNTQAHETHVGTTKDATNATNYTSTLDVPNDVLTHSIIGVGIEVHRHLGPNLQEVLYERAMCIELERRGIPFRAQVPISLGFKGQPIGSYYLDLVVADRVIVELKAVVAFSTSHLAQILSYMAITKLRLGLLMNFNVAVLTRGGIKRVVR
jgi:GxxExxY protein